MCDQKNKKLLKDKSKVNKLYIKTGRKEGNYEKHSNIITNKTNEILNCRKNDFDNLAEKWCDPKLKRKTWIELNRVSLNLKSLNP